DGSYGAIHGPITASRTKNASMPRPVAALGLATKRNRRRRAAADAAGAVASRLLMGMAIASGLLAGSGVQGQVRQVREQVGDQHGERDDQEDALHQRVVLGAPGRTRRTGPGR